MHSPTLYQPSLSPSYTASQGDPSSKEREVGQEPGEAGWSQEGANPRPRDGRLASRGV